MVDPDRIPRSVELSRGENGFVFSYLDERKLPTACVLEATSSWRQVIDAVKTLAVRGAPAIGIAGASAVVLWAVSEDASSNAFEAACEEISAARPTAVNLRWAVTRMAEFARTITGFPACLDDPEARTAACEQLYEHAIAMQEEDVATNHAIARYGAELVKPGSSVLTHCNAGSLATVHYGTALGVIYDAAKQGKIMHVYADETRPVNQGARLTTWELARAGVPVTLICDNMAASLMGKGEIDMVIVGADRIAANGDVANKIGTYGVAVLAKHHGIPFYVAAPASTFDFSLDTGLKIPIEERDPAEVLPEPIEGVSVYNPAFDVTPASLITAIITDKGVFAPDKLDACALGLNAAGQSRKD